MSAPGFDRRSVMRRVWAGLGVLAVIFAAGPIAVWALGDKALAPNPLNRVVTVRFVENSGPGTPWKVRPEQSRMDLHLGETGMAFFDISNPHDHPVAANATYIVTPPAADRYLVRVSCNCGDSQVLGPGESAQIPMGFYVDPAISYDRTADQIREITLSYTYHQTELPAEGASAEPATANAPVN